MFRKIANTFGTRLAAAVINFLIVVVVSQTLGAVGKGQQGILITTIALVLIFSNIVGGASLVYLTPRYPVKRLIAPAYGWSIAMGFLLAYVFAFFKMIPVEWTLHVAMLSILNSWVSINSSILIGRQKIARSNWINLLQSFFLIVVLLVMILVFKVENIAAYTVSLYIAFLLCFVLSAAFIIPLARSSEDPAGPYGNLIRDLFRFGIMNQLAHIAQMLSFRISYFFLDDMVGEKAVGVYSNGVSLMESVWMISSSIALVQYSRISNSDDRVWAREITARLTRYGIWASFLVILPLVLLPGEFYVFLFGAEFAGVAQVMRLLAPGVLVFTFALIVGHYFSGTGRYYVNAIASWAGLVITVLVSLWLIPRYSINGAAIAASISYLSTALIVIIWYGSERSSGVWKLFPRFSDVGEVYRSTKEFLRNLKNKNQDNNG